MATLAQAECREVCYPENCKSVQARKKHKEKTLRENPDVLYADYIQLNGRKIKNNFIFYTARIDAWKSVICEKYTHIFKEGIGRGGRLTICEDEMLDTDNPILTITYYTKGTFLLQGNEASLNSFEAIFPQLKVRIEEERDQTSAKNSDSEEEDPVNPSPSHSDHRLRDTLALLELDFTEFKEHTQTNTNTYIQEMKHQLQQLKKDSSSSITELTKAVRELKEENQALRSQMCKLEQDAMKKEENFSRQLQEMREQLQKTQKDNNPPDCTAPSTVQTTTDHSNYTNTDSTSTTTPEMPTETEELPTLPPDPDVLLLVDSNGKFLDPQKLFPHQKVTAKRCSTTSHAQQIIKDFSGQPSCVIIHTGTNDLHSLHNNTADAVRKTAEITSQKFPESRIVISTLLPRRDTPPHIIYNINAEISRACSAFPNVHLAHHQHISLQHLYDGLHLHKDAVRVFAKSLKDAALGRSSTPRKHLLPTPDHYRPIPYRPVHPYIPQHSPPTSVRKDFRWTSSSHRPPSRPHRPMAPYTPVNLQSQNTHPPERKKKPQTTPQQERLSQPRPQSYAEAVARPSAPPTTSTPANELSQIKEMLHTLCSQLLKR